MATGDKKRAVMTTDIDNGSSTYPVLSPSGDGSDVTAAFTAASTRTNISTGEKLGILFGKIAKWFTDLGAAAFRGVDAAPTAGSTNLVESGGVKNALDAMNTLYTDSVTITNSAFTGSGITLYKKGNFVSFKVLLQSDNPNASAYTLGTVPIGFRPMIDGIQLDINQENTGGAKSFCVIRFDTYGSVYLIPSANSGTTYYRGAGCYIV